MQNFDQKPGSVSIVVVCHNYEAYVRFAIESALTQTIPAVEVIVVDDGSTDNSRDIISSYGQSVVPIFKSAGGHVTAVNAGYAVATGDLCIFLDADDILYPNCISTTILHWRKGDAKIQFRLDTIDKDGINKNLPFPYFPDDLDPQEVRRQSFRFGVYPWTVSSGNAFSRSLLDALLPIDPVAVYRSPDGYLSKMAPLFGDVRSISSILGAYRVHGKNAWAQDGVSIRLEPIERWLKFDQVLHHKFQAEALRQGVPVVQAGQIRTLQQAEYQFLALRFAQNSYIAGTTSLLRVFKQGLAAAWSAPNTSWLGRVIWVFWISAIAFLPKSIVSGIFNAARGQGKRSSISQVLVRFSRGDAH